MPSERLAALMGTVMEPLEPTALNSPVQIAHHGDHLQHAMSEVHGEASAAGNHRPAVAVLRNPLQPVATPETQLPQVTIIDDPVSGMTFKERCPANRRCTDALVGGKLNHLEFDANGVPIVKDVVGSIGTVRTIYDRDGNVTALQFSDTGRRALTGIVRYNSQGVRASADFTSWNSTTHSEFDASGMLRREVTGPLNSQPGPVEIVVHKANGEIVETFGSMINGRLQTDRLEISHPDGSTATVLFDGQTGKPSKVIEYDRQWHTLGHFNVNKDGVYRDDFADLFETHPFFRSF